MEMNGPGSHGELLGLYFPDGRQHIDHHTNQLHRSPNATSDLLFKGALKDRGRSVYQGYIKVWPNAQKTNAYQANRNLLLSKNARADSIPGLEIEANDVRCTHGATASQLQEEYVFYLMSRGHRPGRTPNGWWSRASWRKCWTASRSRVCGPSWRTRSRASWGCRAGTPWPRRAMLILRKVVTTGVGGRSSERSDQVRIVESNEDVLLYSRGHVPGAVNIDWVADLNDPVVRDYLDREQFERLMSRHGIANDTRSSSTATRTTGGRAMRCGCSSCSATPTAPSWTAGG